MTPPTWVYGVTTTSSPRKYLGATLTSLAEAGFPSPLIFTDPGIRPFGSGSYGTVAIWVLGASRLLLQYPSADYYAMFQDDILVHPLLRSILDQTLGQDRTQSPSASYWNLITYADNETIIRDKPHGWYKTNTGRGAQALVFSRDCLLALLTSRTIWTWGDKCLDGAIAASLQGTWQEMIHNPSLVQHVGYTSAMDKTSIYQANTFDPLWRPC